MDEESRDLFIYHTPWGLPCLNTLVMGAHSVGREPQERLRVRVKGLKGVTQIKDDMVIH